MPCVQLSGLGHRHGKQARARAAILRDFEGWRKEEIEEKETERRTGVYGGK